MLIVVAVVGILATQASFRYTKQQMKAKRTEVTIGLAALADAQKAFYLEHQRFAGTFEELAFDIDGAKLLSPTVLEARRYTYAVSQPWGERSYYITAAGQIDSDAFPDVHVLEAGRP